MNKRYSLQADLSLVLVAIIWGSGFIASKYALANSMSVGMIMASRFVIAALVIFVLFSSKIIKSRQNNYGGAILNGLLLFLGFYTQTWGLRYTTPSNNAFITSTNVVIVPFLSWFILRKRPGISPILSSFLCLAGIGFLSYSKDSGLNFGLGNLLTLLCAIFFAGHISCMDVIAKKMDYRPLTFIQMITAAFLSVISLLFEPNSISRQSFNLGALLPVIYLGLFSTCFCFLIQTAAQKHTTSTHTAIILASEALFGSFFSVLLGFEPLSASLVIGGTMIASAVLLCEIRH